VIILEGPDGAGKTSLIRHLNDWLAMPVAPRVVGQDTKPLVDIYEWTNKNLAEGFQDKLFDRHRLISEPIYSTVMGGDRDEQFWDPAWMGAALRALREIQPIVIWCLPSFKAVNHNVLGDPHNQTVWMHIDKIYKAYQYAWLLNTYAPYQVLWDYQNTDLRWFQDHLTNLIRRRKDS
jgi:hypothetical protein